ncbi:hypothetical protein GS446_25305 [Rhodococcus hoagii]|nr:hypothetical protein [Prescottella equi]
MRVPRRCHLFAGSDAALKEEEAESAKKNCGDEGAFQVPAYISPIAVAYNCRARRTSR